MWRVLGMKRNRNTNKTDSSFEDICWITDDSSSKMTIAGAFYSTIIIVIIIQQSWILHGMLQFIVKRKKQTFLDACNGTGTQGTTCWPY